MLLDGKKMAYVSILLGINQVILLSTALLRLNTLFLLGIASIMIGIVIFEYGIKVGSIFYIASLILGAILVPDKLIVLNYGVFFGLYAIVKYYIEYYCHNKQKSSYFEIITKLIYFNTILFVVYFGIKMLLVDGNLHIAFVLFLGEIVFWIYDYAFGLFIHFYVVKIRRYLPF